MVETRVRGENDDEISQGHQMEDKLEGFVNLNM